MWKEVTWLGVVELVWSPLRLEVGYHKLMKLKLQAPHLHRPLQGPWRSTSSIFTWSNVSVKVSKVRRLRLLSFHFLPPPPHPQH